MEQTARLEFLHFFTPCGSWSNSVLRSFYSANYSIFKRIIQSGNAFPRCKFMLSNAGHYPSSWKTPTCWRMKNKRPKNPFPQVDQKRALRNNWTIIFVWGDRPGKGDPFLDLGAGRTSFNLNCRNPFQFQIIHFNGFCVSSDRPLKKRGFVEWKGNEWVMLQVLSLTLFF